MHIAQWSAKAKSVFIGTYLFISLCCVLIYFVVYTAGSWLLIAVLRRFLKHVH